MPALTGLVVGDDVDAWRSAGFTIDGGRTIIGGVTLELVGSDHRRGLRAMAVEPPTGPIDGLELVDIARAGQPLEHPNHVSAIDHLVVVTPDSDRTTMALEEVGIEARRVRTFAVGATLRRQTFFWLGDVILELVGSDPADGDGPAELWGLAFTTPDLEATCRVLGAAVGPQKDAVQAGRRIATLRHEHIGVSVPVAFMTPHERGV